jgi:hypothetical protein
MTPMPDRFQHLIYFSISLQDRVSLDELAAEAARALGATFSLSTERGTMGYYESEVLGLHLWLFVAEPPTPQSAPQFSFIGGPDDEGEEEGQLDIGTYIAELLTRRTGRAWTTRKLSGI